LLPEDLLPRVKKNLIIDFSDDDELLAGMVAAAIDYAESFQNRETGHYAENGMPPATEQAVVMLASQYYESRDGSGDTFFGGGYRSGAAGNAKRAVDDLLRLNRDWKV
jgi:uncharacterized phage protein (predicted DNA packaging)